MIFTSFLITSIILSIVTAVILLKMLNQMLIMTVNQIISEELRTPWIKYVQIALLVVGVSSGVDISGTKELISQRNLQSISWDVFSMQIWSAIHGTAIAIILAVLLLFFIYLVIYYLNQMIGKDDVK